MTSATRRWRGGEINLALTAATLAAAVTLPFQPSSAAPLEPAITPTVHPAIAPNSAIPVPLLVRADKTSVWKSDLEQRMLVSGRVRIEIGYRTLRADNAAIWLTPSRDFGENALDVAIFLSGNIHLAEGDRSTSTQTTGKELLVTTRISRSVQLTGTPVSKVEEDSPVFKRGEEIRQELLRRPAAPPFIPQITITTAEAALQEGWIAKGPNNRLIAGPGEVLAQRDPQGRIQLVTPEKRPKPPRPRPKALIATDQEIHREQRGNEWLTIIRNPYMLLDLKDGSPPLEFHADNMVAFTPAEKGEAPRGGGGGDPLAEAARYITGVYLEGDVSFDFGDNHVRASRLYVDLTSQRAIMLDATLSSVDKVRNIPVYLRAEQIRMLSRTEFAAKKATFSTSEFYTPHYSIGAGDIFLQNLAEPEEVAGPGGELPTFGYKVKDATIRIQGVPVFYWPYLAGDTGRNEIPLRRIRIGNSNTYGMSIQTDWDLFGLAGQVAPKGIRTHLYLDYFGDRGPGAGVDANWTGEDYHGLLRSYIMEDHGKDRLGIDRKNIPFEDNVRGRITVRHQQDLDTGLTLAVEASYISDPNFLQQYFSSEFNADKEQETSIYLKKQGETDALTFLAKGSLFDFTATADQVDDQYSVNKLPEVKYWRIGDSFFDRLTYYSESSASYLQANITDFTPTELGMRPTFIGPPAAVVPLNVRYRDFYKADPNDPDPAKRGLGFTTQGVLRGDTRHEINMPLQVGDLKITPYITGRITAWDNEWPEPSSGNTVRLWGQAGIRGSMAFWKTYHDVNSMFWDVHGLRHIIEPQFNLFASGSTEDRADLQLFDRDVEGISEASGGSLGIRNKWQTKRGGEGRWRNVDWLVINMQINQFWNRDHSSMLNPLDPLRGYYFLSRPELSLNRSSVAVDGVWRMGERARLIGEFNLNTDSGRIEQFATGLIIDQTDNLAWFIGNRYVDALNTDEWTVAVDYKLTRKYEIIAAESYDIEQNGNILTSVTLVRKFPRFNTGLTISYNANQADTTVMFTAWPEGFPEAGVGNRGARSGQYK